jgi:DNA-binding response OmpR family regulator
MAIAVALLVSDDPVAIQELSHGLEELSISADVCQDGPASIRLLNCRKFDAVIVDLQLGEQSGAVLNAAHLSPSNQTAVSFAIGSNAAVTSAFSKRASFVFERPLSTPSIRSLLTDSS